MRNFESGGTWARSGAMGMIREPFRVGKFAVGDHLAYRLWHNDQLVGEFASFEEAEAKATELQAGNAES